MLILHFWVVVLLHLQSHQSPIFPILLKKCKKSFLTLSNSFQFWHLPIPHQVSTCECEHVDLHPIARFAHQDHGLAQHRVLVVGLVVLVVEGRDLGPVLPDG